MNARKNAHPDPTTLEWLFMRCHPIPFSGCWAWAGPLKRNGYADVSVKQNGIFRTMQGHVAAYRMKHGAIPDGMHVDHLCRVRCCINPDHLEAVTPIENNRRACINPVALAAAWRHALT